MTETERLRQIWRQLRDYGSRRDFEMDYKFLRSCMRYSVVVNCNLHRKALVGALPTMITV